jgi:hypothetical protein
MTHCFNTCQHQSESYNFVLYMTRQTKFHKVVTRREKIRKESDFVPNSLLTSLSTSTSFTFLSSFYYYFISTSFFCTIISLNFLEHSYGKEKKKILTQVSWLVLHPFFLFLLFHSHQHYSYLIGTFLRSSTFFLLIFSSIFQILYFIVHFY